MNRKRFMKCRLFRRCGALLLAVALSLSVFGTGSAFADTTDNGDEIVEMTVSGDYEASVYEASIDEAGGYVYYAFTPEESGTYRFYTTGDYDTYAYIYDADWNELDSDDDSGSDVNANIAISLEAGNTYYIVFRFSSETMGSFSVYAEKVNVAVSAELVLSQELVRYKGLDSCEEYDDDNEVYDYYYIDYGLNFTSGDQIVLTLEDGSTVTCTSDGSFYFYDEDDERLSFDCSSDQSSEHWEVGNTYYFTYTLTEYVIDVQIPVTIAAPDPAAFTELVTDTEYTAVIEEAGGYVYYAFTPEESGSYCFYTTGDSDTYAYIYDADWNLLASNDDSGTNTNAKIIISLEAGDTYYIAFRFYSSDTTGSFGVYLEMTGSRESDDDSSSDNSGTSGDDSSGADDSGTSDDDSSGADDSSTVGDGSTSDDDGSNGGNSDDNGSSDQLNSGQTGGGSTNLKTQKITVKKAQLKKTIHTKKLKKKPRPSS